MKKIRLSFPQSFGGNPESWIPDQSIRGGDKEIRMNNKKKNVLGIIYQTHHQEKERMILIEDILSKFSDDTSLDSLEMILDFFNKHIPVHFACEETMIHALDDCRLTPDERDITSMILREHEDLRGKFDKIKSLIMKIKGGDKNLRDGLIEAVNEAMNLLTIHAKKEDDLLYPLAQKKLTEAQKQDIDKKVSKILS